MKLTIYNNNNCIVEKNGNCLFRVSKRGFCTITSPGLELLDLKVGDRIVVANEDGTKNWYIKKVADDAGFELRSISNSIGFKNSAFNEEITRRLKLDGTVGFLICRKPVTIDGEEYYQLITSRPVKTEAGKWDRNKGN